MILKRTFQEGAEPEVVLGVLAGLFRDFLLAKLWLKEGRDRKEIFAFIKPQVKPHFSFYQTEFRRLFSIVERMTLGEMRWAVRELEEIDVLIKTTGAAAEPLLDRFVVEYCGRQKRIPERKGLTWRAVD
jgi:DNA polymerase III delta subunit